MNKLLVSGIVNLKSDSYIVNLSNESIINIDGKVIIYLINEVSDKLNIYLKDNSYLELYKINDNKVKNLEVNIYQNNSSVLYYNESFITNDNNNLVINNYVNGDNNYSNINVRCISNNGNSVIVVNENIIKNTSNNIALEDLKGVNNGGTVHIEPNIICESNEVSANHLTTIGKLDEESINYIKSKGISEDNAKELLLNGFMYSNMDDYIKEVGGE